MIPSVKALAMTDDERQLLNQYRLLGDDDQRTLRLFAEFLADRNGAGTSRTVPVSDPVDIDRPAGESVVAAMRRLRETYPMLEAAELLHQAAGLLAEHTMQGRDAEAVIDDLERLFATHYQRVRDAWENEQ